MDRKGQGNHRKLVPSFSKLLKVHTDRLAHLKTQEAEHIQKNGLAEQVSQSTRLKTWIATVLPNHPSVCQHGYHL